MSTFVHTTIEELFADQRGQPQTRTANQSAVWRPTLTWQFVDFQALHDDVSRLTPPNEKLREFARLNPPDDSWWKDETNPFDAEAT